jgi:hypothetical protein
VPPSTWSSPSSSQGSSTGPTSTITTTTASPKINSNVTTNHAPVPSTSNAGKKEKRIILIDGSNVAIGFSNSLGGKRENDYKQFSAEGNY